MYRPNRAMTHNNATISRPTRVRHIRNATRMTPGGFLSSDFDIVGRGDVGRRELRVLIASSFAVVV